MKLSKVGVPHARFWLASPKEDERKKIFLECERWYDARDIARRYFGTNVALREIEVRDGDIIQVPIVQVRWGGSAYGANNLRKQVRVVPLNSKSKGKWKELHEFPS